MQLQAKLFPSGLGPTHWLVEPGLEACQVGQWPSGRGLGSDWGVTGAAGHGLGLEGVVGQKVQHLGAERRLERGGK